MKSKMILCGVALTAMLAGCSKPGGNTYSTPSYETGGAAADEMLATDPGGEKYKPNAISPVHMVADAPVSTFAVDVDTGAYANVRRFLTQGQKPPVDAVRTEEMINYFRYDYPLPTDREAPFSVTTDVAQSPWNQDTKILRIGLRGYDLPYSGRPAANLVFLVDVSGSMDEPDKLPLVKSALSTLADNLGREDRVAIVVYAGAAGVVLDSTSDPAEIKDALDELSAGGSTAGGEGLQLAYSIAREHFIKGGVNRILVATDGDFNVGITDQAELEKLIEHERDDGITLTTLGFGQGNLNDSLMESIADLGNGNYAYIDSAMEAKKVLSEELSSTLFTIAKDVKVQVEFNPAYVSQYRLIGYENRALAEQDFDNDKVDAGDIGAGHQVTAIYEVVPTGTKGWLSDRRYTDNRREATGEAGRRNGVRPPPLQIARRQHLPPDRAPGGRPLLATRALPQGDMAFATAVAAFGQKLRGDTRLGDIAYADIRRLAGNPDGYWRQEFVKLTELAEARQVPGNRDGTGSAREVRARHDCHSRERPGKCPTPAALSRHPNKRLTPREPPPSLAPTPRGSLMKLLLATALAISAAPAAAQTAPRPDQLAFRDLYKELVETDTSVSTGSCTAAARRWPPASRPPAIPTIRSPCSRSTASRSTAGSWPGSPAPRPARSRCCCSAISTWSTPAARTGSAIPTRSSRRTAISTAAAPPT